MARGLACEGSRASSGELEDMLGFKNSDKDGEGEEEG